MSLAFLLTDRLPRRKGWLTKAFNANAFFATVPYYGVWSVALQPDGKILVGGVCSPYARLVAANACGTGGASNQITVVVPPGT